MSIGDKIREQRIKLGLSQEELALKMGYNGRSTIAKIESGAVEVSHTKVVQYAKILGVSVDYLLCRTNIKKFDDFPPEVKRVTELLAGVDGEKRKTLEKLLIELLEK